MQILKNQTFLFVSTVVIISVMLMLFSSDQKLSVAMFVAALLIIAKVAHSSLKKQVSSEQWIDAEWSPCEDDGNNRTF